MIHHEPETPAGDVPAVESKHKIDVATEVRERISYTLRTRQQPRGTLSARLEDRVKRGGTKVWSAVKKRPIAGVALAGGAAFVMVSTLGVGELAFTAVVAYAAFQVLREGVAPSKAAAEMFESIER